MIETVFGKTQDNEYMQEALIEAQKAFDEDEVPVGAVVVSPEGTIIGRAHNRVEQEHTQRAHAESLAIEIAGKTQNDWRLYDCWLYVTLEPCSMCMGLVTLSRLAGVIYGTSSPLFGFRLDNEDDLRVYKKDAFLIVEGVRQEESSDMLKKFFKQKRKKNE